MVSARIFICGSALVSLIFNEIFRFGFSCMWIEIILFCFGLDSCSMEYFIAFVSVSNFTPDSFSDLFRIECRRIFCHVGIGLRFDVFFSCHVWINFEWHFEVREGLHIDGINFVVSNCVVVQ